MSDRPDAADPFVPDDLGVVIATVQDLAYYRTVPIAGDLSRATAALLLEMVRRLPDHTREDG